MVWWSVLGGVVLCGVMLAVSIYLIRLSTRPLPDPAQEPRTGVIQTVETSKSGVVYLRFVDNPEISYQTHSKYRNLVSIERIDRAAELSTPIQYRVLDGNPSYHTELVSLEANGEPILSVEDALEVAIGERKGFVVLGVFCAISTIAVAAYFRLDKTWCVLTQVTRANSALSTTKEHQVLDPDE